MIERQGIIRFNDQEVTIVGKDITVGQVAPEFTATTQEWENVSILRHTQGKVRILSSVLSLDTSVCDRETKQFNQEAAQLSKDIAIVVISADLPFTQKRWCGAAGIDQVMVVSDHQSMEFGEKYACLIKEVRFLRRAVFVVNRNDRVTYVEYMPELGLEPDYKAVLRAASDALKN
jgi:thiol peroxidase